MIGSEDPVVADGNSHPEPPKLFALLGSITVVSLVVATEFLERGGNPYLRGSGVAVLLVAAGFIFVPFYLLAKHGRTQNGQTYMLANIVVDRGLYAITRHPQYLGYIFLGCGFALLSQHWAAVLLAATGFVFFHLQAVAEEKYCLARLGRPYEQYRRRVPRFNVILGVLRLLRGGRK